MVQRCENAGAKDYKNYGGRGIKIHPSIRLFESFYAYMGPSNGLTIERIDVNGDYAPGNIKWIPLADQGKNRRNNVNVIYKGRQYGIRYCIANFKTNQNIYYRLIRNGFTPQKAFEISTPGAV
jgi:hypothetical protein